MHTVIVITLLTMKATPNPIDPYFSLLGPTLPFLLSLNRQMTIEALKTARNVSRADAKTAELSIVAEAKKEAAQKITDAIKLATATVKEALLHLRLWLSLGTESCLPSSVSSVVKETQGFFSGMLSLIAGLNSALNATANLGVSVGESPWTRLVEL